MCGIAGIIGGPAGRRERIAAMTAALAHRGPDGEGIEHYDGASFGHRRLSVIDLALGRQPMQSASGEMHLVFNGEIYNYRELRAELAADGARFATNSDTEVVLRLYEREGGRCVRRLRGMFAFAVWEAPRRRLFLARDRMGQKPLFYRFLADGGLAFASEVKGLLAGGFASPALDRQALYHYVSLRYIPDERTLFDGIAKLPAAHTLTFDEHGARVERYWSVAYHDKHQAGERELREELDRRLRESVRLHAIADVPVGAFLSGGIDSSLITAMHADQSEGPIDTFSIGVREQGFSELPYARRVAERWRTRHHEGLAAADLVHTLPRMIWHMDEPSDPFGVGVWLVAGLAAPHVKVVLTGDGGDELFAGYDRYAGNRLVELYALVPAAARRVLVRSLAERIPDSFGYKSLAQKVRWVNEMSLVAGGERYALSMSFLRFSEDAKRELFTREVLAGLAEPDSTVKILEHYGAACVGDAVDRMLHTDCMTRLPEHLLLLVDRMAMAHGVEARPPLLDHEVVEFAARVPARLKLNGRRLKYLLRETARRYAPDDIVDRPKQGFGFPIARWMRTELRIFMRRAFRRSRLVEAGVFRAPYVERLLEEHLAGRRDHNLRLWVLLNLELWHRIYLEGQAPDALAEWIAAQAAAAGTPVRAAAVAGAGA